MQVHLVLPGLLWPAQALPDVMFDLELPVLSWLLGRAQPRPSAPLPLEAWLAARFGHAGAGPAAALRLLGEGGEPGRSDWICADPGHLAFEHGHPILTDPARLDLQPDESAEIAAALAPTFATVGRFSLNPSGHGYVELATAADIVAAPLSAVVGRGGGVLLPGGNTGARWVRLANEAQIELHGLDCNRRREAAGRPTVNTLWFWGGGHLPEAVTVPYTAVGGGGTLARGYARHAGAAWQAAADGLPTEGNTLLIDERLLAPAQQLEAGDWRDAMLALERDRLAPLVAALRGGRLTKLSLTGLGDAVTLDLELGRAAALCFWRRPRSLVEAVAA